MTHIIIPIKDINKAKSRLAVKLNQQARAALSLAMLNDLLMALQDINFSSVSVVTCNSSVCELAKRHGASPIKEGSSVGYNEAVARGLNQLKLGQDVAILPGDIPLVTSADVSKLIRPGQKGEKIVRLATTRRAFGTNGIFMSSRNILIPEFGANSFQKHFAQALKIGLTPEIINAPNLQHDIDTIADLLDFKKKSHKGATFELINSKEFSKRLNYIDV